MRSTARNVILVSLALAASLVACRDPDITQRKQIGVAPIGENIGYQRAAVEYKGNASASAMMAPGVDEQIAAALKAAESGK
jgi:hypothetical protein